ncbi:MULTISPECIES: ROK family protein [unclassified Nocardia]|uniref:ROK family protein n=1 Tax=unclassified Nocardia TaxID=2637762 RepID=UPI001CE3C021|nr:MULTISPECIES: ROK family protein [unclassified Nocardia]
MPRTAQEPAKNGIGELLLALHTLGGSATRAELTERLGCGRSVTGYLLRELDQLGMIGVDREHQRSEGGRPSHRIRIADTGPVVLAIQLHAATVSAARVALGGRILERVDRDLPSRDVADVVRELCCLVVELAPTIRPLLGLGIAVPGPVRLPDGQVRAATHLGWPRSVPLARLVRAELPPHLTDLPIEVGNDANLAAWAEHRHGAGRAAAQLLYLTTTRVGLGGALVSGGQLFSGAHGYAIEPGHITVDPAGARCRCGSTGCLEVEADQRALLRAAGVPDLPDGEIPDAAAEVVAAARAGDAHARTAVRRLNTRLGSGLASLANIIDTDRIVLGGTLAALYELDPATVRDQLAARAFLVDIDEITIAPEQLPDSALLGAAELAWHPLLTDPRRTLNTAHQPQRA